MKQLLTIPVIAGFCFVCAAINSHTDKAAATSRTPAPTSSPSPVVAASQTPDISKLTGNESVAQIMDVLNCDVTTARDIFYKQAVKTRGEPPEIRGAWGVSLYIHAAIKKELRDPDSYQFISANGAWADGYKGQPCWLIKVMFRSKNGFGGYVQDIADIHVVTKNGIETVLNVNLEE